MSANLIFQYVISAKDYIQFFSEIGPLIERWLMEL